MSVTFVPRKRPDSVDLLWRALEAREYSQSAERPTTKPKKRLPFAIIDPTTIPEKEQDGDDHELDQPRREAPPGRRVLHWG